jgi:hypothetical protein
MKYLAYDFEVFMHFWCVVIINIDDLEERTVIINDSEKLKEFYFNNVNNIYIGYNSRNYDVWIYKSILSGMNPYWMSTQLFKGFKGYKMIRNESDYPIYNFDASDKFHSLKEKEAHMGSEIKESEVSFELDRPLTNEEIVEVIKYNTHDVLETIKLVKFQIKTLEAQKLMIDAFSLPMSSYNKTNAMISAEVLGAVRQVRLDDDYDYSFPDTLDLPDKYKYIIDWYKNPINKDSGKKLITNVAGVEFIFAWGGVHAAIPNYQDNCSDGSILLSADVASLYPALIIEYNLLSRNVTDADKYKQIRDRRLVLKKEKNPIQEALKLIINTTYGATNDFRNLLYDPLQANSVCVYGQLLLLDLVSKVEDYCKLIQCNTDGILIRVKDRETVDKIKDICAEWETRTRLNLEFEEFSGIYEKDVNNYLVLSADGSYKSKGSYVKKLSKIDYDLPILNEALVNYFTKNIPVEQTIIECDELIKFQKIVKITGLYKHAIHNGKPLKEKVNRVFASINQIDTSILKLKGENKLEKMANTPDHLFIDNSDITNKKVPPHLDKQWYIDFANKRLSDFLTEKDEISKEEKMANLRIQITGLSQQHSSFYNLLLANKELKIASTAELSTIIKLDTLSKYGLSQKLITCLEYFNLFYNKKSPKIKTTDEKLINESGKVRDLIISILTSNSIPSETAYSKLNSEQSLREIFDIIPNEDVHYTEKIKLQLEYEKTIRYVNPDIPINHLYVVNYHQMNNHLIGVYNLNNGVAMHLKIDKKIFNILPCQEGDVICSGGYESKFGKRVIGKNSDGINIIDDDTTRTEWWLTSYEILYRDSIHKSEIILEKT